MSEEQKDMAERTCILRCLVGSQAYGTSLGNSSDRDEKGVCIEDFSAFCPLGGQFEQYEYRTAAARTGVKDAKSEEGDLDLTIYSFRKYLQLATYGNPNIVELLFIKGEALLQRKPEGQMLQDLYPFIISRQAAKRYLGYMEAQKQRLLGERGQMRVTRTDLIDAHGYDTKYAMHVLRLGFQGIELQETGKLVLPIEEPTREILLDVRKGKYGLNEVLQLCGDLEAKLKDLVKLGPLMEFPDYARVTTFMQKLYWETWSLRRHGMLIMEGSPHVH